MAQDERRSSAWPWRQVNEWLSTRQPRASARDLLGALGQAQAALRERLIAAGQADQGQGIAERSSLSYALGSENILGADWELNFRDEDGSWNSIDIGSGERLEV